LSLQFAGAANSEIKMNNSGNIYCGNYL
jgi:hypothetical protein